MLLNNLAVASRRAIYTILGTTDRFVRQSYPDIVIFSYHSISSDSWRFSITFEALQKQVTYLMQYYAIVSLDELAEHLQKNKPFDKPVAIITFDDGYKDIFQTRHFFQSLGIQPTLFLLSDPASADTAELATDRQFLNKDELLQLKEMGWVFGCHSATHPFFGTLTASAAQNEIVLAKQVLENQLGVNIRYFAYPRGRYTPIVLQAVRKAGYELGLSMDDGFINTQSSLLTLPRIGVDRTHGFEEFPYIYSRSVIQFRRLIKNTFIGNYL